MKASGYIARDLSFLKFPYSFRVDTLEEAIDLIGRSRKTSAELYEVEEIDEIPFKTKLAVINAGKWTTLNRDKLTLETVNQVLDEADAEFTAALLIGDDYKAKRKRTMAKNEKTERDVAADLIGDNGGKPSKAEKKAKKGKSERVTPAKLKKQAIKNIAAKNGKTVKGTSKRGPKAEIDDKKKIRLLVKDRSVQADTVSGKKWNLLKDGITVGDWRKKCKASKLPGTGAAVLGGWIRKGMVKLV